MPRAEGAAASGSYDRDLYSELSAVSQTGRGITKPELIGIIRQHAFREGGSSPTDQLTSTELAALGRALENLPWGSTQAQSLAGELARGVRPSRKGIMR